MEKIARGRGDGRQTWKRRKKEVRKVVSCSHLFRVGSSGMEKVARGRGDSKQTWKRRKKEVRKVVDKKNLIRGSNKR
jgi:hypothetical protein